MKQKNIKKLLILNIPYVIIGLIATNVGEVFRIASGTNASEKVQSVVLDGCFGTAFSNPMPSFHPIDLLVGLAIGGVLRLAVYIKSKNAKKFRHNQEYGSARWGTHADIEPFIYPKVENNVILTATERLTMNISILLECNVIRLRYILSFHLQLHPLYKGACFLDNHHSQTTV